MEEEVGLGGGVNLLEARRDNGTVEIVGRADFDGCHEVRRDVGTSHEGIAQAMTIVGRKGEVVEHGGLVAIEARGVVVGMEPGDAGGEAEPAVAPGSLLGEQDARRGRSLSRTVSWEIYTIGLGDEGERSRAVGRTARRLTNEDGGLQTETMLGMVEKTGMVGIVTLTETETITAFKVYIFK